MSLYAPGGEPKVIRFPSRSARIHRLIVHQIDLSRPTPGGIDTCIRGICEYLPDGIDIAVVGVDASGAEGRARIGKWQECEIASRRIWFLPVVRLDPAGQSRKIPHTLRVILGLMRFLPKLPNADVIQVHRMDIALALRHLLRKPQTYFIHTQENGLLGSNSDSFWRFFGGLYARLEFGVIAQAKSVVVFNERNSQLVKRVNANAVFSPTWYDPKLIRSGNHRDDYRVVWVGRLEKPKDPELAIRAFDELVRRDPDAPWTLDIVGSGTLKAKLETQLADLPCSTADRVRLLGRLPPEEVAAAMGESGLFMMTSHPGYEGYPRVLVESMASGLASVITSGSDTGGLVANGRTGFICSRDPQEIASRLRDAQIIDRRLVREAVEPLQAPRIVKELLALDHEIEK
jgi:glycosyltransferase involved in cell wall biosynthesis